MQQPARPWLLRQQIADDWAGMRETSHTVLVLSLRHRLQRWDKDAMNLRDALRMPSSDVTEEAVDRDRLAIRFGPHVAAVDGAPSPDYDEAVMSAYMKNDEIDITVHVGSGRASATVWTCDLTKRYIEINGDYRS